MSVESYLQELAQHAEGAVKGVDWDKLDEQGKGVPLDPSQDAHADYMYLYLGPALDRAGRVMNTLYYDPVLVNKAQTESSVKAVANNLYDGAKETLMSLAGGTGFFSLLKGGITFHLQNLRDLISLAYGSALFGAKLHTAAGNYGVVFLGRRAWRDHGDRVCRILNAIAMLDDLGVLKFLKWDSSFMENLRIEQGLPANAPNPMKGLGAIPVLGIAIAIVAGLVLLGGIWIWSATANEYNRQALEILSQICMSPQQDESTKKQCVQALSQPQAGFASVAMKLGTTALTYAFVGALVVGGIYLAPTIVRSVRKAKAEARA